MNPGVSFAMINLRFGTPIGTPRKLHYQAWYTPVIPLIQLCLAPQAGFEPATRCLEGSRSIP